MNVSLRNPQSRRRLHAIAIVCLAASLAGCNQIEDFFGIGKSSSNSDAFRPRTSAYASLPTAPIVVRGDRMVFWADEASSGVHGQNLNAANGDLGTDDQIPVLINMADNSGTLLRAATQRAEILGANVYLAVSENADSWDWNGDGLLSDLVLVHFPGSGGSPAAPNCEFVDVLDGGATVPFLVANNRLYYSAALTQPVPAGQSNLKWVDTAHPTTPTRVAHNVTALAGAGVLPRMVREDEGLLFLEMSEQFGVDLNGDGDTNDTTVLALLDTSDPAAVLLSTQLALPVGITPLRARSTGTSDWTVAFLVSEAQQANFPTGLNDAIGLGFPAGWFPSNCPGFNDTDTADNVLHFLQFAAWSANPGANPPQNTGLAGAFRVLVVNGFVATLTIESDDGGCSSNGDADTNDFVLRWTSTANPLAPFTNENQLVAVRAGTGGGGFGVAELGDRFVCIADEAADSRNHDADPNVASLLVAWLDPADGALASWTYDHDPTKVGIQAAGATWLAEAAGRTRIAIGYQESVVGKSLNTSDTDLLDSVPAFAHFDSANPDRLRFAYATAALNQANPGLMIAGNWAFFRVDEAADNRDWTGTNMLADQVMMVSGLATPGLGFVSALNTLPISAVVSDGKVGAAFLVQESMALRDFNGDGDMTDFVVRWMTFE